MGTPLDKTQHPMRYGNSVPRSSHTWECLVFQLTFFVTWGTVDSNQITEDTIVHIQWNPTQWTPLNSKGHF